jgi:uncharacterized phage protein (TIGR02218 family)
MSRNAIEATNEMARGALNINCARTLPLLEMFKFAPPGDVVTVSLYRLHRGETEAITAWMGRVLNVTWRGLEAVLHCESVYTSIKRPGLRRMYQKQCPHVLYSTPCGLDRNDHVVAASVASINGLNLTLNGIGAYASGSFNGGYVEWEAPQGQFERRAIREHAGSVVTVNFQALGLSPLQEIFLYPGCDHTMATCSSKFSNLENYGGFPYIPAKNPFGGNPVY